MYKIYTHKRGMPIRHLHQFLRVMKLITLILITAIMQVSAATYAQRITLKEKDATLETVFKDIRKQTGYDFYFDQNVIQKAKPVSVDLKDVSLEDALKSCLADQPFTYSVEEKTIVIREKAPTFFDKIKKVLTPPADVIGRVTNEQGQPLNGATITIKRTQVGTLSDANGNFMVLGVSSADTLIVSYLGYAKAFVRVDDQTSLKVVLKVTSNQLDQVVIQAYGETSQRLATGNIGTLTAKDIAKQPVMNVLEALQGQVPGVIVTNSSGYASGTVKVEIRGRSTINPNVPSDPLYILDGVPITILDVSNTATYANGSQGFLANGFGSPANGQSPLFSLNPLDIESISILKDADATAIYGSRGANGVILITTKKGKAGKTKLDMNLYSGFSDIPRHYAMLNTQQYTAMRREALANDGLPADITNAPDLVAWDNNRYTDWQKYLWGGIGKTTDAQASLSGGDERTVFRLSAGYRNQTDIMTVSGVNQRANLSLNLTHKSLNQRFSVALDATYSYAFIDLVNVPSNSVLLPPNAPAVFDSKGNLNFAGYAPLQSLYNFQSLLQPYTSATNFLNSSMILSYELLKGMTFKTTFGYNNVQANQTNFAPIISQDPANNPTGSSSFGYNYIHNLLVEPQFEYNSYIGKGKFNVLLGGSIQNNKTDGIATSGDGYTNDALLKSINLAPSKNVFDNFGEYKYEAVFARINYNWENKYIVNLNARRDGSSKFGPGKQFGNFGSIGGSWLFSEEDWIKNKLPFLSFGKLRASYGITGNDQIGDYRFLSRWSSTGLSYNGVLPLVPQGHSDSLLKWEVNRKTEIALDLGFFKDRISLEIARYRNRCNDQLIQFPTPAFTGFINVTANTPADVENTGWEFVINGKLIDGENFKWSAKFNVGINRNKLLAYPNLSQSPYADFFVIGQSLNVKKLLHYTGVDPQTGLYTFEDKNHDGQISIDYTGKTPDDRYTVDLSPKYDGGFMNNFSYKNWELSAFFYFRKQMGQNALLNSDIPGSIGNQPSSILGNEWKKPGDIASVARFTTSPNDPSYQNFQSYSDGVYTDASFIRLQNLSLSYRFSDKFLKKLAVSNLRIFLQGENLFIITRYKGIDPEVQFFGGLPLPRIITTGISCNL